MARKYTINLKLTVESVKNLEDKFRMMKDRLPQLQRTFVQKSLDYLNVQAAYYVDESTGNGSYIPTENLRNSFVKTNDGELGTLINNAFYSALVEYGTGVKGMGTYQGALPPGWQYDVNQHGEAGWSYQGTDGKWYHTTGLQAHNFMYNAVNDYLFRKEYMRCFEEAFAEVIGRDLK